MTAPHSSTPPTVSVVVPARNRARLLPRAVDSVLRQTVSDFEVLVVDDGSTDSTPDVVRELDDPRIRYLRQAPAGAAAARNLGAREAAGRWLVFLDSDDEARPRWLERLLDSVRGNDTALTFGGLQFRETDGSTQVRLPVHLGPLFDDWQGLFLAGTFLLERTLFLEVGGYREDLPASQHTELGFRLVDRCRELGVTPGRVDEPLILAHRHDGPRIRHDSRALLDATEMLLTEYEQRLRRYPLDYVDYRSIAGVHALRLGERRRARSHFREALRVQPRSWKNLLRYLRTFVPVP